MSPSGPEESCRRSSGPPPGWIAPDSRAGDVPLPINSTQDSKMPRLSLWQVTPRSFATPIFCSLNRGSDFTHLGPSETILTWEATVSRRALGRRRRQGWHQGIRYHYAPSTSFPALYRPRRWMSSAVSTPSHTPVAELTLNWESQGSPWGGRYTANPMWRTRHECQGLAP